MTAAEWVLVLVALAIWYSPVLIIAYKEGGLFSHYTVGWFIGLTGLGLVSLIVPPFALGWLAALLLAMIVF